MMPKWATSLEPAIKRLIMMLVAAGIAIPLPAFSTTVERFSLEDMVGKSGRIVVGRCLSVELHWNDHNTLILTTSRFAISQFLKGPSQNMVSVTTVGGTLDGVTQTVSGMPEFQPDEELLLFLEPCKSGGWQILGMSQGRFEIIKNSETGEDEVVRSLVGLDLYDLGTKSLSRQDKPLRLPLRFLLERIRAMVLSPR